MSKLTRFFILSLSILFLAGCSENEPDMEQPGLYEKGVFVTNEGKFGEASASLSFYDPETQEVTNNLFSALSPDDALGDVVQSSHIADDKLFIVVNNSNKVEVLNIGDSMERAYTLQDVALPRYMTSHDGIGYLTEWVSFSEPGRVSIFDLQTGEIEKSVLTGYGTEGVLVAEDQLFVTNSFSTTLVIIDLSTQQISDTVEVGSSPAEMVLDADGDVWVICSGGFDENYAPLNNGKLVEINPTDHSIKKEIALNQNVLGKIAVSNDGGTIYYLAANQIFAFDVVESEAPATAFIEEADALSFYGIGISQDGVIYASDAKGFNENGEVFRYHPDGTFINKFSTGIAPNGFSFN